MQNSIAIPDFYFFRMAKQDYANWKSALAREFYQNSIDAQATRIDITFDLENNMISVLDNGCGMDEDIIKNKLLVLGGSHKEGSGVGAFGKAKELLFFSWPFYHIHTKGIEVQGEASRYAIDNAQEHINGTKATIKIPDNENIEFIKEFFINVAQKIQTKCKIYIDGEHIPFAHNKGKLRSESSWYKIYQNKSASSNMAQFRINGIWMFDRYIGGNHGQIFVELNNNSLEYLTSNRDALKYTYQREIDELINDLQVNQRKLDDNTDDVFEKIEGEGSVVVKGELTFDDLDDLVDYIEDGKSQDVLSVLSKNIPENRNSDVYKDITSKRYDSIKQTLEEAIQNESSYVSKLDSCKPLEFLGYQPDFVLKYKGKRTKRIEKFMETNKASLLANIWTEIVKQVMIDNEIYTRFVAGYVFDSNACAMYCRNNGEQCILVNPFKIGEETGVKQVMTNRKVLVEALKSSACHEIAHMFEDNHNENFVKFEHKIRANTWKSDRIYRDIGKMNG